MAREHVVNGLAQRPRALAMDEPNRRQAREERVVEVFLDDATRLVGGPAEQVQLPGDVRLSGDPDRAGPGCARRDLAQALHGDPDGNRPGGDGGDGPRDGLELSTDPEVRRLDGIAGGERPACAERWARARSMSVGSRPRRAAIARA